MSIEKFASDSSSFFKHSWEKGTTFSPAKELGNSFYREESNSFKKSSSLGARVVCALMIPIHAAGIVVKPLIYGGAAVVFSCSAAVLLACSTGMKVLKLCNLTERKLPAKLSPGKVFKLSLNSAGCAIVSPLGQTAELAKAGVGVFLPKAYFKKESGRINFENKENGINNPPANTPVFPDARPLELQQAVSPSRTNYLAGESRTFGLNKFSRLYTLTISRDDLMKDPKESLYALAYQVRNNNITAFEVNFAGEMGLDTGGLRREFITILFTQLSEKYKLHQEELVALSDENKDVIKNIGILLRLLLEGFNGSNSTCETPIGETINRNYIEYMLYFDYEELEKDFEQIDTSTLLDFLLITTPQDDPAWKQYQGLQDLVNWDGSLNENTQKYYQELIEYYNTAFGWNEKFQIEAINDDLLDELKEYIREDMAHALGGIKTLHTLAKAMCPSEDLWQILKGHGYRQICTHVMGNEFNLEALKDALVFSNLSPEKKDAIGKWIDTKSEEELKNLLAYVTGSTIVPRELIFQGIENTKFTYKNKEFVLEPTSMEAHTCYYQVDIPFDLDNGTMLATLDSYCIKRNKRDNAFNVQ